MVRDGRLLTIAYQIYKEHRFERFNDNFTTRWRQFEIGSV